MKRRETTGLVPAIGSVCASILVIAGCAQAPDLQTVRAERAKAVTRLDTFQSAASHGAVLVAGTASGVIVSSRDAGITWTRQQLTAPASIIALAACPDGSFAGLDFYQKVWVGDRTGQAWSPWAIGTKSTPIALTCDPANRLWVVGSNTSIQSSADKGASWKAADLAKDAIFTTVQFLDEKRGLITGEFGTFVATTDGGTTWAKKGELPGEFYPYSAVFADAQRGWVSGLAGAILHTSDGGRTWRKQENRTGAPMYALVRLGEEVFGLGVGGQMVVLRGDEWVRFEHGKAVPAYLAAGAAVDSAALLVTGAAGALHVINATARLAANSGGSQ